jgi:hypothetical protein
VEPPVAIVDSFEYFYSPTRRQSSLEYPTPNEFEDLHSPRQMNCTNPVPNLPCNQK